MGFETRYERIRSKNTNYTPDQKLLGRRLYNLSLLSRLTPEVPSTFDDYTLRNASDKLLLTMSNTGEQYAFPVIPENMRAGITVFALPTDLTHFFRRSSSLPLCLSLPQARFSLIFRIRKSRNTSEVQVKATNRAGLVHWGISGSSTFLYPVRSSRWFSEIRVCARDRILNHAEPFHPKLRLPGPIMHSPGSSCRMWRCRVLALVIRHCSTHVHLISWWASNERLGRR